MLRMCVTFGPAQRKPATALVPHTRAHTQLQRLGAALILAAAVFYYFHATFHGGARAVNLLPMLRHPAQSHDAQNVQRYTVSHTRTRTHAHADEAAKHQDGNTRMLLVVSAGGSGTSYIMAELQRRLAGMYILNHIDDADDLKHGLPTHTYVRRLVTGRCPVERSRTGSEKGPVEWEAEVQERVCRRTFVGQPHRVLYVLGEAFEIVKSHFKHGRVPRLHASIKGYASTRQQMEAAAANMPWHPPDNFSAFALAAMAAQDDVFGVVEHVRAWRDTRAFTAPILFVSLPFIVAHHDRICAFLEAESGCLHGIALKPRTPAAAGLRVPYTDVAALYSRLSGNEISPRDGEIFLRGESLGSVGDQRWRGESV